MSYSMFIFTTFRFKFCFSVTCFICEGDLNHFFRVNSLLFYVFGPQYLIIQLNFFRVCAFIIKCNIDLIVETCSSIFKFQFTEIICYRSMLCFLDKISLNYFILTLCIFGFWSRISYRFFLNNDRKLNVLIGFINLYVLLILNYKTQI